MAGRIKDLETPLDKIWLEFKGNRLKNVDVRSVNVTVRLQVDFNESGYSVTSSSSKRIDKHYPQILTDDEMQLINSATGQSILKQIEQQLAL